MTTESKKTLTQDYNQEGIKTIHGLAAVRKRPGMYVGSTQSLNGHNSHGLIQIAQEVLSNAIDEAYSGFGDVITFTIHKDNSVTVQDRGRGMPKGKNYDDVIRAVTVLHSSGKFDAKSYANSIGQNGVGIKATNALSKYIEVEAITTNKEHYYIKFNQEQVVEKKKLPYDKSMHTGTKITFLPDDTVFSTIDWEDEPLENKIEQSAYLTPKIKFIFTDERKTMSVPIDNSDTDSTESLDSSDSEISTEPDTTSDESDSDNDSIPETKEVTYQKTWYSKHGLADYVAHLAEDEDLIRGLNKPIDFKGNYDYKTSKATGTIEVQGAIMYTDGSGENILSFANGAPTIDGGYHVDGAKQGVYQAIKDYINSNDKILKKNQSIDSQDTRDGLILALLVKIPENILQFESQSKTKLSTTTAKTATKNIIYDQFTKWLYDNPKLAKQIVQNMADSKNARITAIKAKKAAREARKTKNNNGKLYVSPKLRTATAKDPKDKELYIVEGDSACLQEDTKIRLADGRNLTIKEITKEFQNGKTNYVYSSNITEENMYHNKLTSRSLAVEPITWAGITRKNAKFIRVYIDNGTYIDCTPDHKFLLIDGTYKEAQDLTPDDSLQVMPLKYDDENYMLYKWKPVHKIIAEQLNLISKDNPTHLQVHHKDGNKHNNTPENLVALNAHDHARITAQQVENRYGISFGKLTSNLYHNDPEYHKRQKEIQAMGGHAGKGSKHHVNWTPELKEKYSKTTKEGMKKIPKSKWHDMRVQQKITCTLAFYKTLLRHGISLDDIKDAVHPTKSGKWSPKQLKDPQTGKYKTQMALWKRQYGSGTRAVALTYPEIMKYYNNDDDLLEAIKHVNHRIVKITPLAKCQDAYDITVAKTHNFVLSNDVFVHNCSGLSKGRNPKTQAIFPIRGKILNTEGKKLSRVIKNQEISTIASVLKAGIGKDIFNPKDLDYDKIIIASDADPDGYAIRILLITLFFNFFPGLIENGHLYYVNAPLFKISHYVRGKQVNDYVYTEAERDQVVNKLPKSAKVTVSRFKGLGEMSTEESKKTLLDPSSRYLTRVSSTDFKASKEILRLIEGKKSAPRKQWIIDNVNFDETTE